MNMYRLSAVAILVFCFTHVGLSQNFLEKGVIGGLNYASYGGPDADAYALEPELILRYTWGGFVTIKLNKMLSLRPEMHYAMKGVQYHEGEPGFSFFIEKRMNYIDIPVLCVYAPQPRIKTYAGPYFGFFLNGESYLKWSMDLGRREGSETEDIERGDVRSPDVGVVLGASFDMFNRDMYNRITLHVRYSRGLVTMDNVRDSDTKHYGLQLLISTTF